MKSRRVRIQALTTALEPRLGAGVDRLLAHHRDALVPPRAHLEPVADRIRDAEADPRRILLAAYLEATLETLGFLDAEIDEQVPATLEVAQLIVTPRARYRGLGRRLVRGAVDLAEPPIGAVRASFLGSSSGEAASFWRALGLCGEGTTLEGPIEDLALRPSD